MFHKLTEADDKEPVVTATTDGDGDWVRRPANSPYSFLRTSGAFKLAEVKTNLECN